MSIDIRFNIPALFILIGIVLGFLLSFFFIKTAKQHSKANVFMGLLILTFTFNMVEGWLNYTGLIFNGLHLTNFSEPTNFIIAPLLYLFVSRQLGEPTKKTEWLHYVPFLFWLGYSFFFFKQSADFKYNSNIFSLDLDIEPLPIDYKQSNDDPFGIRNYVNELTISHILVYSVLIIKKLWTKSLSLGANLFNTTNSTLKSLRSSAYHFATLFILLVIVKLTFKNDVGDYIMYVYLSFMLLLTMIKVMDSSTYFTQPSSFLEFPSLKYKKSSLTADSQVIILDKIINLMTSEQYYKYNLASLTDLSTKLNESSHHVSQAINEGMNKSFFELLAYYRVEEAKSILASVEGKKLTVEEIAEQVGYNSKSAFNTAFKKLTNQTPSEYRSAH